MVRIPAGCVVATLVLAGCSSGTTQPSEVDPTGPPSVRAGVVSAHAEQFDEELADRPAGSQQEQAASEYVLAHLQQAGYFVQLDAVPVANLVESTNLVALPPGGEDATRAVVVAYDADESTTESGETIGVFLEVARALYALDRDHRVEFVALGADQTENHLGSRRLAQQLIEQERDLDLITLAPGMERFGASGALAEGIASAAREVGVDEMPPVDPELVGGVDVFAEAGFDSAVVGGPASDVGRVLLEYLDDE